MLIIPSDKPFAKYCDGHITVTLPSGSYPLEIRLTTDQAMMLAETTRMAALDAFEAQKKQNATAEIIAFPREVPALARRERQIAEIIRNARAVAKHD